MRCVIAVMRKAIVTIMSLRIMLSHALAHIFSWQCSCSWGISLYISNVMCHTVCKGGTPYTLPSYKACSAVGRLLCRVVAVPRIDMATRPVSSARLRRSSSHRHGHKACLVPSGCIVDKATRPVQFHLLGVVDKVIHLHLSSGDDPTPPTGMISTPAGPWLGSLTAATSSPCHLRDTCVAHH